MRKVKAAAPKNYEDLYTNWKQFAVKILRSYGVHESDLEDCFMELVANAVETDLLATYAPEKGASWTTYFARSIRWLASNWVAKKKKAPLSLVLDNGEEDEHYSTPSSLQVDEEHARVVAIREALDTAMEILAEKEKRQSTYREATRAYVDPDGVALEVKVSARTLLELYTKGYSREEILDILGINNIWLLRKHLKDAFSQAYR